MTGTTDIQVGEAEEKQSGTASDLYTSGDEEAEYEVWVDREEREVWVGKMDFILSCIGYAVGLGNVWRFPYLCYRSGGGAFLIPYFFFMLVCGMPLMMLEMSLGQFCSLSPTALFNKLCPLASGVGWAMCFVSGVCCIYYNIIIAWAIYYLYLSLRPVLPWTTCGNLWNTIHCVVGIGDLRVNESLVNASQDTGLNTSITETVKKTASREFWKHYVLRLTDGVEDLGSMRWELVLSLVLAWILIFACLFKGVQSSGRVVYFTATFPYVVLVILAIRGLTLPGASIGLKYYLIPQWEKLAELGTWQAAASQIFYSLGPAWGALITMSSYNGFHHGCYRTAIIIPLVNCGTSVFAGVVVFSIIGFMAQESDTDIKDVIASGPGLAFIVYPEALSRLPVSPLWACLFFFMLILIGVDTQFGMFETLISAVVDTWPRQLRQRKVAFTAAVCAAMFVLGLPFVTEGGMYLFQLLDWYSATYALMAISLLECTVVMYVYGWRRYLADLRLMLGRDIPRWWPLCWGLITPSVILGLLISAIAGHAAVVYDSYEYPGWAIGMGWASAAFSVLPIPALAAQALLAAPGHSWLCRLAHCLRPSPDWGPARLKDRVLYQESLSTQPPNLIMVSTGLAPLTQKTENM